jgi:hypothetical protein
MNQFHPKHSTSQSAQAGLQTGSERWLSMGTANAPRGVLLLVALLLGLTQALGQVSANKPRTTAKQISSVSRTLSVPTRNGAAQRLLVEITDWSFSGNETEFDLPAGVSGIMTVINGRVAIAAEGVPKQYSTGDYWTAAPGAHMAVAIQAPARSAIVRTIIAVSTN